MVRQTILQQFHRMLAPATGQFTFVALKGPERRFFGQDQKQSVWLREWARSKKIAVHLNDNPIARPLEFIHALARKGAAAIVFRIARADAHFVA